MATHVARRPVGAGRAASTLWAFIKAVREAPHVAVVILGGFTFVAIFAGLIAPHDPTLPVKGANVFDPPFWMEGGNMTAPLGTDFQGRDILSRLIYGARVSLIVGRWARYHNASKSSRPCSSSDNRAPGPFLMVAPEGPALLRCSRSGFPVAPNSDRTEAPGGGQVCIAPLY